MTVTASNNPAKVIISEGGAKGNKGDAGDNATGLNDIRKAMIDSPLCHLLSTNSVSVVSAPLNTGADVTTDRSSDGTLINRYGEVQTKTSNEIREEKSGFLIESASTNSCLFSTDFTSGWGEVNTTTTSNTTTAPDETITADTLNSTVIAGYTGRNIAISDDGLTRTASIFLKQGTAAITTVSIFNTNGSSVTNSFSFDWATFGTISGTGRIVQLNNNGWVRVDVQAVNNNSGNSNGIIRIYPAGATSGSTGTVIAWLAQFEDSAFSTSAIYTSTAPATRALDDISTPTLNNMPPISGDWGIYLEYENQGLSTGLNEYVLTVANDGGHLAFALLNSALNVLNFRVNGGVSTVIVAGALTANERVKVLITNESGVLSIYKDGILADSATPVNYPLLDLSGKIAIGNRFNSTAETAPGNYSNLMIWDLHS